MFECWNAVITKNQKQVLVNVWYFYIFLTEQRHLTDTQFRLVDNSSIQKQLNEAAEYAEMDLKAKQIDKNVEVCVPMSL